MRGLCESRSLTDTVEQPPPGFGWDPRKREHTLEARGIDFHDAATVFDDIHTRYVFDRVDPKTGEERTRAIGPSRDGTLLVVAFADRVDNEGNELIWIISAREAEKHEREAYEEDPWP